MIDEAKNIIDLGSLCKQEQKQQHKGMEMHQQYSLGDLPSVVLSDYGKNFYILIELPEITLFLSQNGEIKYEAEVQYPESLIDFYTEGRHKGRVKQIYEYNFVYNDNGSIKSINNIQFFYYTTSRGNYIKSMGNIPVEYKNLGTDNVRVTRIGDVYFSYNNLNLLTINKEYIGDNIPIRLID